MNDAPCFLDVNVPMYAAGQDQRLKAACVWVMEEIVADRLNVVIDTEIIQEILYRYGAIGRWQTGVHMAESLLVLVPVVLPVTVTDIKSAVSLFARYASQGVTARDVLHAAVMETHQLSRIISTDTHFDQLTGITRLDPLQLLADAGTGT